MTSSNRTHAPPSHILSVPFSMGALVAIHIVALLALGRNWTGGCGGLWQSDMAAECNSMHLTDPYSFMHVGFGIGIGAMFRALRPAWRARDIMLLVVFSSTVWELVENLPPVVAMFGYDDRPELAYDGDSIVNSVGDTVATALGGAVALTISWKVALAVIVLIEAVSSLGMGDGYLLGLMRLFGG